LVISISVSCNALNSKDLPCLDSSKPILQSDFGTEGGGLLESVKRCLVMLYERASPKQGGRFTKMVRFDSCSLFDRTSVN